VARRGRTPAGRDVPDAPEAERRANEIRFPAVERDLAVARVRLHDIGRLESYVGEHGYIDLTDAGRLEGKIPLG
jgi:hypothetical protein